MFLFFSLHLFLKASLLHFDSCSVCPYGCFHITPTTPNSQPLHPSLYTPLPPGSVSLARACLHHQPACLVDWHVCSSAAQRKPGKKSDWKKISNYSSNVPFKLFSCCCCLCVFFGGGRGFLSSRPQAFMLKGSKKGLCCQALFKCSCIPGCCPLALASKSSHLRLKPVLFGKGIFTNGFKEVCFYIVSSWSFPLVSSILDRK